MVNGIRKFGEEFILFFDLVGRVVVFVWFRGGVFYGEYFECVVIVGCVGVVLI